MRAELGAQLHLLGCLLQLLGDVSEEEKWSRDCDSKQLWEVTRRSAAQVQAERRSVFELVADVQSVVFLRDVAVDGLSIGFVLLHRLEHTPVDRLELIQLARLRVGADESTRELLTSKTVAIVKPARAT